MQKNKVSPEFHSESFPLIRETPSVNHFDDDVFTLLYSDLSTGRIPSYTYPHAGGKIRQESSIDYSDILNPVSLDEFSHCSSPISSLTEDHVQKCNKQKILHYLADLHRRSDHGEIDLAQLEALLAAGADINASTGKGFTSLHQSVVRFPLKVAQWLVENGAYVERVDQWGWSALHLACIENKPDIIKLLCKRNSNILCIQTHKMQHTALHIAALSDIDDVISEVVHCMKDSLALNPNRDAVLRGWLESRDYQGRTALHLATHYDRSTSARYLLEHSLSNPATLDAYGQFCLVQLIEKMAFVSTVALDKLYFTDTLSRKQVFCLNFLEKKTNIDISRTPLDSVHLCSGDF